MAYTLHLVQIISSIVLVVLILLQRTNGDNSTALGGDSMSFLQTRRGAERFLFMLTVTVAVVFVGSSIAVILL